MVLWVIFLNVAWAAFSPKTEGAGYTPVYTQEVKGARTAPTVTAERIAIISDEITEVRVLPSETPTPTPTILSLPEKKYEKSRQIGEYTWTIDIPDEERSATAEEILSALNAYRQKHGRAALSWDDRLASYAQSRADAFAANSKTDSHAGFLDYINNQDGFMKLGFMKLGENSSYGYKVSGITLIESVYAGDSPHDTNQLSSDWTHVGIGVSSVATNLVFGGRPM